MIELIEKYKKYRYNLNIDKCIKKWGLLIDNKIEVKNKKLVEELSIFLEIYTLIESEILKIQKHYPDDYITIQESLDLISKDIIDFVVNDSVTKLDIIKEYYNIITCKKGFLLEGNIRI